MSEMAAHRQVSQFTIGVPAHAAEPDLAETLASLQRSGDLAGCAYEMVVAVNGPQDPAPAVTGVREFAALAGIALDEGGETEAPAPDCECEPVTDESGRDGVGRGSGARASGSCLGVRLLRLARPNKAAAWNAIRGAVRAPVIVFADADVRVAPGAIGLLLARLAAEPDLAVVAGREAAVVERGDGLPARLAALPYRFDFGNLPGRLYAMRSTALAEPMPDHVVSEDAFLTVKLGRARFAKEDAALVYLRPPLGWRDYLRQRVRNEVGKLQLAREFPDLLRAHGFGRYPWREFLARIRPGEYPLVAASLAARVYARLLARRQAGGGFRPGWDMLESTKRWSRSQARETQTTSGRASATTRAEGGEAGN